MDAGPVGEAAPERFFEVEEGLVELVYRAVEGGEIKIKERFTRVSADGETRQADGIIIGIIFRLCREGEPAVEKFFQTDLFCRVHRGEGRRSTGGFPEFCAGG